jgi:sodium/potassium-transporting ATPase subunit alpha
MTGTQSAGTPTREGGPAGPHTGLNDTGFHRLRDTEALKMLDTSPSGLSHEEVHRRLLQTGPNSLQEIKSTPLASRFLRQFTHFLAILLWIAAGLSFLAEALHPGQGMATLGWAILGVILINAVFTFVQEYKAERAVQALRRMLPATAWVIRAGHAEQVSRRELVPGDILLLEEGEQVSADARLIEANHMRVDNSSLTGEALPRPRRIEPVPAGNALDAPNLVFAGTTVLSGRGRAVVYATGLRTEFGKIAHLAAAVEPGLSPLQREIVKVTHLIALLSAIMGVIFFVISFSMGMGIWVSSILGIGILVAFVPEGLLPTVTLALARGSQRMAKRRAIIKHLTSVETLGCTTVICTDKTGTLTENRMRVDRLFVDGEEIEARDGRLLQEGREPSAFGLRNWQALFRGFALCNNARRLRKRGNNESFSGDPTETALAEFAHAYGHKVGEDATVERFPRMGELPFDADRKRMSTIHWVEGKLVAFVKGAPELVLPMCDQALIRGNTFLMTPGEREKVLAQSRAFAHQAYRVLAVATREIEQGPGKLDSEAVERGLTFLGLVAMMDPPHKEVPEAVARCRQAGIRVIMTTGDHPLTALAVARKIGLVPAESSDGSAITPIEGEQLDALSDEELRHLLAPSTKATPEPVFARMAPRHKMRLVSLLKGMGEVVAVTGDGVNDAPALHKADIGIAMGVAGTDVAKESADMILLDDNFATIVNAIEEGRAVYANIRRFVTYVLAHTTPELVPYLAYGLFAIPPALTVPQILAVDLGTDIVPALALGAEPPHSDLMDVPPRPRSERLLNLPLLLRAYVFLGLIEAGVAMAAFFWFLYAQGWTWGTPLDWTDPLYRQATTVTFAAIVIAQIANVFACRSERISIFRLGFFSNPFILWGIAVELALLALIVYTPFGNLVFGTEPLPPWAWGPLVLGAAGLLFADEIRKLVIGKSRPESSRPG